MNPEWRPWRESNPHLGLRSALLCPLSYGGVRRGLYRGQPRVNPELDVTNEGKCSDRRGRAVRP